MNEKRHREELKTKRNLLFQRLLKNPLETHLAVEIKVIDDQVAEWTQKMLMESEDMELMEKKTPPIRKGSSND